MGQMRKYILGARESLEDVFSGFRLDAAFFLQHAATILMTKCEEKILSKMPDHNNLILEKNCAQALEDLRPLDIFQAGGDKHANLIDGVVGLVRGVANRVGPTAEVVEGYNHFLQKKGRP